MLNSLAKYHRHARPVEQYDEYGQKQETDNSTQKLLKMSIVFNDAQYMVDSPEFENVKYIGIYEGPHFDFRPGDLIDNKYRIVRVIKFSNRQKFLYLEEVLNGKPQQ